MCFKVSFLVLVCLSLCAVYAYCLACALRGELDLVRDEETGRPINTARFVNPFSSSSWFPWRRGVGSRRLRDSYDLTEGPASSRTEMHEVLE